MRRQPWGEEKRKEEGEDEEERRRRGRGRRGRREVDRKEALRAWAPRPLPAPQACVLPAHLRAGRPTAVLGLPE